MSEAMADNKNFPREVPVKLGRNCRDAVALPGDAPCFLQAPLATALLRAGVRMLLNFLEANGQEALLGI